EGFLSAAAAKHGLWVARGQCLEQFGDGEAYLPVLEAIGRLCRESKRESLLPLLERFAPTWLVHLTSIADVADRQRLQRETFGATPERMLREMAEAVEEISGRAPVVLLLEDLQWSDPSTVDLISSLARRRESARLLVIGTYRSTEVSAGAH